MQKARLLFLAFVIASISHVMPAFAEGMTAEEFKKIVIGNTLELKYSSSTRDLEFRFYFIDDKKLRFTSSGSSPAADEPWSVSDGAKFCYHFSPRDNTRCISGIRREGNKLFGKSRRGNKRVLLLLKGRHTYQCSRC